MEVKSLEFNLLEVIREQIKTFEISEKFYRDLEDKIKFTFQSINFEISQEKLLLEDKIIKNPDELDIRRIKGIFKNYLEVNGIKIKEENKKIEKFVEIILSEWVDFQGEIKILNLDHIIYDYSDNMKFKYLENLNGILRDTQDYIIRRKKYIYVIGRSLQLELRPLKAFVIKDEIKKVNMEIINEENTMISDYVGYFKCYGMELPRLKEMKNILNLSKEKEKLYEILEDNYKRELKNKVKLKKILVKNHKNLEREVIFNEIFSNCNRDILVRGRKRTMKEIKIIFTRNGNEHYYLKTMGEDRKVEFLRNICEEDGVSLEDDKRDTIDFKMLLQSKDDKILDQELMEKYSSYRKDLRGIEFKERENISIPRNIDLCDITEKTIVGHLELNKDYLQSGGVWAYQGKRLLKVTFENLLSELKKIDNIELDYKLILEQAGNNVENREFDISKDVKSNIENKDMDTHDLEIVFPIDTMELGKYLKEDYSFVNLNFVLELSIELNDVEQKFVLGVPLVIKLNNPSHKDFFQNDKAAIDFGTSSTCLALKIGGKSKLLSLEKLDEHAEQAYENPTNLLIKDWEKFYEEWGNKENEYPLPERFEKINDDRGIYSQGHRVVENIKNPTRSELNALIDQLKLIPYKNITLGDKVITRPYHTPRLGVKEIELISEYEKQNKENFDPIGFYGYLLGRVAMAPANERIVKSYSLTVPVKFDRNVKEAILNSLRNGIKLAAPSTIREQIEIKEGEEEPVAFMGAICANGKVKENGWGIGSKFAVFDFGGGTLDFSFGLYRTADEDIESEEDYENMIEIFNTSGDEKGGAEYLIHKISYSLYRANKEIMKENRIPFVVPDGEDELELYPKELQNGKTTPAIFNLKRINEFISRDIFKGTYNNVGAQNLELQDEGGNPKVIAIQVDKDYLVAKLKNYIKGIVEIFEELIVKNLGHLGDPYENLHIFRAGNASRSNLLKESLEECFKEKFVGKNSYIHFIDEPGVNDIKPKTAVALGELNFITSNEIGRVFQNKLEKTATPFEFTVGAPNIENDQEFLEILSIGSTDKEWKKLGRVNRETGEIIIFYTKSVGLKEINNSNIKSNVLKVSEEDLENGNVLWVRALDANKIEYILGKKKEPDMALNGKIFELGRY